MGGWKKDPKLNGGLERSEDLKKIFEKVAIRSPEARHNYQKPILESLQRELDDQGALTVIAGDPGTGKTYLAVHAMMRGLQKGYYDKMVFARPAVEAAGENLGFLPGGFKDKMGPYMQPFFDMMERLGFKVGQIEEMKNSGVIEIAPIAYLRGRTFERCAIIADEMQNANAAQIKLVRSRLGHFSHLCMIGDPGQCDLPGVTPETNAFNNFLEILEHNRDMIIQHDLAIAVHRIPQGAENCRSRIVHELERMEIEANDRDPRPGLG